MKDDFELEEFGIGTPPETSFPRKLALDPDRGRESRQGGAGLLRCTPHPTTPGFPPPIGVEGKLSRE